MVPLLLIFGVGYLSWRQIQLYWAQQLIHDCVQKHNCAEHLDALEQLVKAQQNLKLFNLATANISGANLKNAYLGRINLYRTNLSRTNLQNAYLQSTNLYRANLESTNLTNANLINAKNLTSTQIKSACNWDKAFYQGVWQLNQFRWVVDEKANQQFIQQLKQDEDSDPKQPVDCSQWRHWAQDK